MGFRVFRVFRGKTTASRPRCLQRSHPPPWMRHLASSQPRPRRKHLFIPPSRSFVPFAAPSPRPATTDHTDDTDQDSVIRTFREVRVAPGFFRRTGSASVDSVCSVVKPPHRSPRFRHPFDPWNPWSLPGLISQPVWFPCIPCVPWSNHRFPSAPPRARPSSVVIEPRGRSPSFVSIGVDSWLDRLLPPQETDAAGLPLRRRRITFPTP